MLNSVISTVAEWMEDNGSSLLLFELPVYVQSRGMLSIQRTPKDIARQCALFTRTYGRHHEYPVEPEGCDM